MTDQPHQSAVEDRVVPSGITRLVSLILLSALVFVLGMGH